MQGSKRIYRPLIGLIGIFLTTSGFAVCSLPTGWYGEGNIGGTKFYGQTLPAGSSGQTSGKAWNVSGGYKFNPFFGVEGGYTKYAPTRFRSPQIGSGTLAQIQHSSFDVAGRVMYPIQETGVEPFAKLGVGHIVSKVNHLVPGLQIPGLNTGTTTSNGLYWAAGIAYYFSPNIAANIQYAQARGNSNTGTPAAYTAGLSFLLGNF